VERCGSSRLISVLGGFAGLNVKGEIFNPRVAVSLDAETAALAAVAGIADVEGIFDPRLVHWIRAHPNAVLDFLANLQPKQMLVFKLFGQHIPDASHRQQVMARPDTVFLLIHRRPVDVYISTLKSIVVKGVRHIDTTGVTVTGNVQQFLAALKDWTSWYDEIRAALARSGRPFVDVSYEDDIARPDEVLVKRLVEKLANLGVDPGPFLGIWGRHLERQDRSETYGEKMANWDQFSAELRERPEYSDAFMELPRGSSTTA
jgi:hypothetical protein